jgi:NADH-quinone oxidoreductase subunit J
MNPVLMSTLFFYLLALGAVALALGVVLSRHILWAAVNLMGCLGCIAGLYVLLNAPFMAAVQVLVYIGGIVVLFVLAVMLSSPAELVDSTAPLRRRALGVLVAGAYFILNIFMYRETVFVPRPAVNATVDTAALARSFLDRGPAGYVVPFELLSLLILAAAVGAIVLARKTPPPGSGQDNADGGKGTVL